MGVLLDGEEVRVCGNAYETLECARLILYIKSDIFQIFGSAGCRPCEGFLLGNIFYIYWEGGRYFNG